MNEGLLSKSLISLPFSLYWIWLNLLRVAQNSSQGVVVWSLASNACRFIISSVAQPSVSSTIQNCNLSTSLL